MKNTRPDRPTAPDAPALPPALRAALAHEPPAAQEELARTWDLLDLARPAPPAAAPDDAAWAALQARLAAPTAPPNRAADRPALARVRTARPVRWPLVRWTAAALAACVLLAVGVGWWQQPIRVQAAPGQTLTAALPDGTVVQLNSGSSLAYARQFSRLPFVAAPERAVTLEGEAFFDVAHQTDRRFVVHTAHAEVAVLGTRFNVRARAGETVVALEEGRVAVTPRQQARAAVQLLPGEQVRVTPTVVETPETVSLDHATAWRTGGFAVSNLSLADVFSELERRYAVRIDAAPAVPLDAKLTLFFPRPDGAKAILEDICASRNLQYRRVNQGYEVFTP